MGSTQVQTSAFEELLGQKAAPRRLGATMNNILAMVYKAWIVVDKFQPTTTILFSLSSRTP